MLLLERRCSLARLLLLINRSNMGTTRTRAVPFGMFYAAQVAYS